MLMFGVCLATTLWHVLAQIKRVMEDSRFIYGLHHQCDCWQEPCGAPEAAKAQQHAAGGDRRANPSSNLFAPPAHPLAAVEPARRAPPAPKHLCEPQAGAGDVDGGHATAGLERLLASLQAKVSSRTIQ